MNQLLAALAQPQTSLSLAHSWHTQSQLDTFLAHRRLWPGVAVGAAKIATMSVGDPLPVSTFGPCHARSAHLSPGPFAAE